MTKILPILAVLALFLALSSLGQPVAQAQATAPTVSTIAITSDPGTDNTYTTLDEITVSVTFSEAVTVTGVPRITLDIGAVERVVNYSGAGAVTGQLLFNYEVHPTDQDDDGVGVVANGLALNGGTLLSTDDSTAATLTHAASSFAGHKVDTELRLISNLEQAAGTPLRVSATEAVRIDLTTWESQVIYTLGEIVLDVKTPSDTLDVTVIMANGTRFASRQGNYHDVRFTGSVSASGKQTFKAISYNNLVDVLVTEVVSVGPEGIPLAFLTRFNPGRQFITIVGSGTGFVELGATASTAEDESGAYNWNIGDKVSLSTNGGNTYQQQPSAHLLRFAAMGHTTEILRVESSVISSKPYAGSAYAAGETIEVEIRLNGPVRVLDENLTVPLWLGEGAEHRREARLVSNFTDYGENDDYQESFRKSILQFAYDVRAGDADTDGVLVAENPLGASTDGKIEYAIDSRVSMDLSSQEFQGETVQGVDGSADSTCQAIHCARALVKDLDIQPLHQAGYHILEHVPPEPTGLFGRLLKYQGKEYLITIIYSDVNTGNISPQGSTVTLVFDRHLQQLAIDRLGLKIGNNVFAFRDGAPTTFGEESEFPANSFLRQHAFSWSGTDVSWSDGELVLIKIVETPVTASFDAASYTVDEGGSIDVTVTLGRDFLETPVTLPLAVTNNGGVTGADYTGVPQELVFAIGETEKTFTVTLTQNDLDDDGKSLTLSFGTLPATVKEGGANEQAIVTIRDDDDPEVTVTLEQASYDVPEGGYQTIQVTLNADPERTVVIPIVTTHLGGVASADYSGVPAGVTFNTGEMAKTIPFIATQDSEDDDDERRESWQSGRRCRPGSPGAAIGETTVNIVDDDDPEVTVTLEQSSYAVPEGGSQVIRVTLSADPERTVVSPDHVTTHQDGSDRRRLLGRACQRDLRHRRDGDDLHLQRHPGHRGR